MNVVIRADASESIGSGHVMRCLCLAGMLGEMGASVTFVGRALKGHMLDFIQSAGFGVCVPGGYTCGREDGQSDSREGYTWLQDAGETLECIHESGRTVDLLVVDHYALAEPWEEKLEPHVGMIMVIDDLANRRHACQLLLDQNVYRNPEIRYQGLVPDSCRLLLGPEYALIREEFLRVNTRRRHDGAVSRILVMFGGMDPDNVTGKALQALKMAGVEHLHIDVIVGGKNPNREEIRKLCEKMENTVFHCQPGNIAELMVKADLAIGAGGITILERIYVDLPTIAISVAENQEQSLRDLDSMHALKYLGRNEDVSVADLADALQDYLDGKTRFRKYEINRKSDFLRFELRGSTGGSKTTAPV